MADKKNSHWLQNFVQANAWQIVILGGGALLLASQVKANTNDIDTLKGAVIGITNNQTQILLIQQEQDTTESVIKDLKDEMTKRFDKLEVKIGDL